MLRWQVLSNGLSVRQDFRKCARFVFFDTGLDDWPYGTHGGTAFVINYLGRAYAVTCRHVRQDYKWEQLVITDERFGTEMGKIESVYYPSSPRGEAVGTDLLDVAIIEFASGIGPDFFRDTAYIVDPCSVATSRTGHKLYVAGNLKAMTEITDQGIRPTFCLLEFRDAGASLNDLTLRRGIAEFGEPPFDSITGISGSPVFDDVANALCGMVVRGGLKGSECTIHFVDIHDILKFVDAVYFGRPEARFLKQVVSLRR